jgi:hypothetical protein
MTDERADFLRLKNATGNLTPAEREEYRLVLQSDRTGVDLIGGSYPDDWRGPKYLAVPKRPTSEAEFDAKYNPDVGKVHVAAPNEVLTALDITFTNDGMMRAPAGPLPSPSKIAQFIAQEQRLREQQDNKIKSGNF